jgi:hypothetical protein
MAVLAAVAQIKQARLEPARLGRVITADLTQVPHRVHLAVAVRVQ